MLSSEREKVQDRCLEGAVLALRQTYKGSDEPNGTMEWAALAQAEATVAIALLLEEFVERRREKEAAAA